jgi:hypothetical protein
LSRNSYSPTGTLVVVTLVFSFIGASPFRAVDQSLPSPHRAWTPSTGS